MNHHHSEAKISNKGPMPKLSTMNNLLKLSNKLTMMEFLKEVNYRSTLLNISPIKLLFFFCVEKMVYCIYSTNGFERVRENMGNY
jgi:hypothetical protein